MGSQAMLWARGADGVKYARMGAWPGLNYSQWCFATICSVNVHQEQVKEPFNWSLETQNSDHLFFYNMNQ